MITRTTPAGPVHEPSHFLVDDLVDFARAVDASPWTIEALVDRHGRPELEAAAEHGILEVCCEVGRGDLVAARLAAFRQAGNPARAANLQLLDRLAKTYAPAN